MRRAASSLVAVACLLLALGGCGSDSSSTASSSSSSESETTTAKPASQPAKKKTKPKVVPPKGPAPKNLVVKDLETGTGPAARSGDELTVQYVGVGYESGTQFDASWDRNEPFTFELGGGGLIKGWEKGLVGMKVGGRRELITPPDYAYGPQGSGSIAPNATLVFVIDLLAVK
jgi:peptidylprolyl isomerase